MTTPPLLLLAEGRRVRPRKAPVIRQSEFQIQADAVALARKYPKHGYLFWHTPNGEIRDPRTAAKLKAMGVLPGVPDLIILGPDGQLRCIEFKARGGKLSEEQEAFRYHCINAGVPYVVAYSLDDALAAFRTWDCLSISIAGGA